ncbi:MAG: hypothetical protein QGF67_12285 [Lentisphaeria bacterium]|nr:hypothetical protein [Lentisphaeria bacterium]MDP7742213.1 hypothetical protein [Lentisphaeria bacterium]
MTLEIENQAAGELLRRLVGELGLEFKSSEDQAAALQKTVSLTMSSGSRLEAIESICRQIEMTPVYLQKTVKLRPGARNAAQMPGQLAELTFKGYSPVAMKFISGAGLRLLPGPPPGRVETHGHVTGCHAPNGQPR